MTWPEHYQSWRNNHVVHSRNLKVAYQILNRKVSFSSDPTDGRLALLLNRHNTENLKSMYSGRFESGSA